MPLPLHSCSPCRSPPIRQPARALPRPPPFSRWFFPATTACFSACFISPLEQNLDLAQMLRAQGWNVLAMHYRGSWGVKGEFSFEHAAEDADTEVRYVLDPANAQKYRIDTRRVIVIGHSMGGYMAASATAHNPQVAAAVLISAWNIGADYESRRHLGADPPTIENEAKDLERDNNLMPLSGTSGEALAREIHDHAQ